LPDSERLIALLGAWVDEDESWNPQEFLEAVRSALSPPGAKSSGEHFDRLLNDVAAAFLNPLRGTTLKNLLI
jgi:hypothetical protein